MKDDDYGNDPGLHLTPLGKRVLLALLLIVIGVLFVVGMTMPAGAQDVGPACPTATPTATPGPTGIRLSTFDAAPTAKVCTAWQVTPSNCRRVLGVRVCGRFTLTCVKPTGKVAGLAAPVAGSMGGCHKVVDACKISALNGVAASTICQQGYKFSGARVSRRATFDPDYYYRVSGCSADIFEIDGKTVRIGKRIRITQ